MMIQRKMDTLKQSFKNYYQNSHDQSEIEAKYTKHYSLNLRKWLITGNSSISLRKLG